MSTSLDLRTSAGSDLGAGSRTVVAAACERVADGVVAITLQDPAGGTLPAWEPGAHVDVVLPDGLIRQYSLCGDPADRTRWRIAVLREPDSRGGSAWLHDELRPGAELQVSEPRCNFPLVEADAYLFIAGGIGITPLLPMIAAVAERGRPWRLAYGGRTEASMAFLGELEPHGDSVSPCFQDRDGLLDLAALLGTPRAGTAVYCCGPEPLLAAVEERCAAWPSGSLHVERFRARPGALAGERAAFEVELAGSGETIVVGADQSIVEALDAAGVDVPTSCREGTCGTCETAVLEGTPDHRDSFLTDEEREDNATMMICCSRSLGPKLVLDL